MHIQKFWVLAHSFENPSSYCDLRYQIWDLKMSPSRQIRDLIIGCLTPESVDGRSMQQIAAPPLRVNAMQCAVMPRDRHTAQVDSLDLRDRAPRYRAKAGSGSVVRPEQRRAADQITQTEASQGSARTPLVRPTRRRAGASPQWGCLAFRSSRNLPTRLPSSLPSGRTITQSTMSRSESV